MHSLFIASICMFKEIAFAAKAFFDFAKGLQIPRIGQRIEIENKLLVTINPNLKAL